MQNQLQFQANLPVELLRPACRAALHHRHAVCMTDPEKWIITGKKVLILLVLGFKHEWWCEVTLDFGDIQY